MELKIYRKQLDKIDSQVIKLLEKREKISKKIGQYKKKNKIKVQNKSREKQILKKLNKNYLKHIFKIIMRNSREIQRKS